MDQGCPFSCLHSSAVVTRTSFSRCRAQPSDILIDNAPAFFPTQEGFGVLTRQLPSAEEGQGQKGRSPQYKVATLVVPAPSSPLLSAIIKRRLTFLDFKARTGLHTLHSPFTSAPAALPRPSLAPPPPQFFFFGGSVG